MEEIEKALSVALKAHSGQKDKAGQPYILHPIRVMQRVESYQAKIVALLHDVLEDSDFSLADLKEIGFAPQVLEALVCLTKAENEDYFDYLKRIAQNALAKEVKKADLQDNLDVTRLMVLTEKDRERLNKYLKALRFLKE